MVQLWSGVGHGHEAPPRARGAGGESQLQTPCQLTQSDRQAREGRLGGCRTVLPRPHCHSSVSRFWAELTAEVHDIWRKVVLPRLMGGKTLN